MGCGSRQTSLSLFRDWLAKVKGRRIRQDGYTTASGHVYEFYGEEGTDRASITRQFNEFSTFLDACLERPDQATSTLENGGLGPSEVDEIVARYSKEARRLKIDLRHARESRLLSLRHRLEGELSESGISEMEIARVADSLIPRTDSIAGTITGDETLLSVGSTGAVSIGLTSEMIEKVYSIATQHIQGIRNASAEFQELLRLIDAHGGIQKSELISAIHELEDDDARPQDRIAARQRIKAFVFALGGRAADVGTSLLTRYLEIRFGLNK